MGSLQVSPEVRLRNNMGQFISEIETGLDAALDELETIMHATVKREVPRRRGVLAARTNAVRVGRSVVASSNAYYAGYVRDGTPSHPISPKSGGEGYLANPAEGFFARGKVQHPGTKPNDYLTRTYRIVWPMALGIVDKNVN